MISKNYAFFVAIIAMTFVVVASNVLVQYPVAGTVGGVPLADILTYGAFTYPFAFLVTDIVNRTFGPTLARKVALAGFAVAVIMSFAVASPRIALASGSAFLFAQLLDVSIFEKLRNGSWWRAPLISSAVGSALDTMIFFTLAFSAAIPFEPDTFAITIEPLFGIDGNALAPRWVSWAIADFMVKLLVAGFVLGPYRALTLRLVPRAL